VCACVSNVIKRCASGQGGLILIMITRGDVQRVIDAFILEETLYWWEHPIERINTVRGVDAWNGYHWTWARQLAQDRAWGVLKNYMETMGETYLREAMEYLIQLASPRLYREYWSTCPTPDVEEEEDDESDVHPTFAKTDVGS